jgi:NDP-sugar pyrophosphorylase family protein
VRDSILWNDVVVEAGAEIDGAILADRVHVGNGAQIGTGSVIGHQVEIDSGTRVAPNSRLSTHEVANI